MKTRKILVPLYSSYGEAITGLGEQTSDIADFFKNTDEYDMVLFTGGADISPEYYGDTSPKNMCYTSPRRDAIEKSIFEHALKHNIKMSGICRGIQLFTALCGGKLVHHLDNHEGGSHTFRHYKDDEMFRVNSIHHQMCIPPSDGFIVGWSDVKLSNVYYGDKDQKMVWEGPEIEAILLPHQQCAGVQWHPEMMHKDSTAYKWFYVFMFDFLTKSMDELIDIYTEGHTDGFSLSA